MNEPVIVEFPLRGEWLAPNTPGTKIPSHGTDQFGARYAYDFIQVDWGRSGWPAYRGSLFRYLRSGVPLNDCYCWGQNVCSPVDGTVIQAEDGWAESPRTDLVGDLSRAWKNAHHFDPKRNNAREVAGNYVVIECGERIYAALCHFQTGSIQVTVGQQVRKGEVIGRVGHSGNSLAPHLHFQLMDHRDITIANGIPCAFERCQVFENGNWKTVTDYLPTARDRIRFNP